MNTTSAAASPALTLDADGRFHCPVYRCNLTPRSCVARQTARNQARAGVGGLAYPSCARCPLGPVVAAGLPTAPAPAPAPATAPTPTPTAGDPPAERTRGTRRARPLPDPPSPRSATPASAEPVPTAPPEEPPTMPARQPAPADPTADGAAAPTTPSRCPCGAPSAPTARSKGGGRVGTPEFADICTKHRNRATTRRYAKKITAAEARAQVLAAPEPPDGRAGASKPAPARSTAPKRTSASARPARVAKARAPRGAVPATSTVDLLARVRRERSVIDALGGVEAAEQLAPVVARLGGVPAVVALVEELAR